jgi:hypothetical protein
VLDPEQGAVDPHDWMHVRVAVMPTPHDDDQGFHTD